MKDQNAGEPVTFTMTSGGDDQLVFENRAHDFPQKITYAKISKDAMVAVISGMQNGKQQSQQFPMRRVR